MDISHTIAHTQYTTVSYIHHITPQNTTQWTDHTPTYDKPTNICHHTYDISSRTTLVHALLFCQDHRVCELRKHFSFLFTPFRRTFQQPNPFCCNRSTTNLLMISFLSRTIDFFFFFLSLWIYLWLAKTSQQPIIQTTWLKVTPHCNHSRWCCQSAHTPSPGYETKRHTNKQTR